MNPVLRDPATGRIIDAVEIVDKKTNRSLGTINGYGGLEGLRCRNLTLDTDLYELTMTAGYAHVGKENQTACFDLYYRANPDDGAFCIFAGLEQVIEYINKAGLYPDDLDYLRSLGMFDEAGLEHLSGAAKFTGDIWAMPEGTVVFPNEPLIRVTGPIGQAQLLETTLLALVGHQTLIATKAARMAISARGNPVIDFGTRRAHGVEAALYGARAAYIGGCIGTSNVKAGKLFGIPTYGTHAHSWIESFDTEPEAFRAFAQVYPDNCTLLVDTYETLEGIRNAIETARQMRKTGKKLNGIRIDSGDLAYYSKSARFMLDSAGFPEVKILASGDLDEWLIQSLRDQGALIDVWCVGTRLMTSYHTPALGAVYKLMAVDNGDGVMAPKIKISQNPYKITNPGMKRVVRFFHPDGHMMGDLLTHIDEDVPVDAPVRAHHPTFDHMKKTYRPPYTARELLIPIFRNGRQVYEPPPIGDLRARAEQSIASLEPEYKRLANPHIYKVSLSERIYRTKKELLDYYHDRNHVEHSPQPE